MKVTRST